MLKILAGLTNQVCLQSWWTINKSATRSATKSATLKDQHEGLTNKVITKYEGGDFGTGKIQSYVDVVKRKMRNVHSSLGYWMNSLYLVYLK